MIRIGLIGSDGGIKNGHSLAVTKLFATTNLNAKITCLYGNNIEERNEISQAYGIEKVVDNITDMFGMVDAVMIMQRNGSLHADSAMPFIEEGYPVFIDKPFSCNVYDAQKMVASAQKSGALIFGGSGLKYDSTVLQAKKKLISLKNRGEKLLSGYISYPMYANAEYGGIHFYSHHLIEEMLTVFGNSVHSVWAKSYGSQVAAIADYGDFPVYMNFITEGEGLYIGANFGRESFMYKQENSDLLKKQIEKFLKGIESGTADESSTFFLDAVKISDAIERSIEKNIVTFIK